MSFSAYKALAIPEGDVVQITDEAGNVLWSAVKALIVNVIRPSGSTGSVTIDGIEYTESGTYEALESITVSVQGIFAPSSHFMATAYVYINGVKVAETPTNPPLLDYSLALDGYSKVTIEYKYESSVCNCYITAS